MNEINTHSHTIVITFNNTSEMNILIIIFNILILISFFFLYPSTFNLLEVAAVDRPKLHLWESGIMRITRHPQMVGQFMWCAAHTAYIGMCFRYVHMHICTAFMCAV